MEYADLRKECEEVIHDYFKEHVVNAIIEYQLPSADSEEMNANDVERLFCEAVKDQPTSTVR